MAAISGSTSSCRPPLALPPADEAPHYVQIFHVCGQKSISLMNISETWPFTPKTPNLCFTFWLATFLAAFLWDFTLSECDSEAVRHLTVNVTLLARCGN